MPINGVALASVGAGIVFVWSGVKGWSVLATVGDVITGKQPKESAIYPLAQPGTGNALGSQGNTLSGIANDALQYQGHAYAFGGAPGRNGTQAWDCSSFVNWVVGHDQRMSIPGYGPGKYDGSFHGPPTTAWGVWPGLHSVSRQSVQAGDIIVWLNHMGIAISNTQMISAQDPKDGTKIGPIDGGGNGPLLKYGRLG